MRYRPYIYIFSLCGIFASHCSSYSKCVSPAVEFNDARSRVSDHSIHSCPRRPAFRIAVRSIFPLIVLGIAATNLTPPRSLLYGATFSGQIQCRKIVSTAR